MLTPIFDRWLGELFDSPIPDETEATCSDCAMRPPESGPRDGSAIYFTEDKCCTYFPTLHNYLAGGVLADAAPEAAPGKAALERLLAARIGVSPLAVAAPPPYWPLYHSSNQSFGRSKALRCPYFQVETGACGVWRHRESTCATWFCKHDRGAVGLAFWGAVRTLLSSVEDAVAMHCLVELDVGHEALAALLAGSGEPSATEIDGDVDLPSYTRKWGRWLGREREFFVRSQEIAAGLPWQSALALSGVKGRAQALLARDAHALLLSTEAPLVPLRLGRFSVTQASPTALKLQTYREYDLLEVPPSLYAALRRFDGRPTGAVVAEVALQEGLDLTNDVLRMLADFEVLVPAEASRTPDTAGTRSAEAPGVRPGPPATAPRDGRRS